MTEAAAAAAAWFHEADVDAAAAPRAALSYALLTEDDLPDPAPLCCDIADIAARGAAGAPAAAARPAVAAPLDLEALVDAMCALDIVREVGELPLEARPASVGGPREAEAEAAAALARHADELLRRVGVDPDAGVPADAAAACAEPAAAHAESAGAVGGSGGDGLREVDVVRWAHAMVHGRREPGGPAVGYKRSAADS